MTPAYLKVNIDGSDLANTARFLILLDATATHELNRHPICRVQYRQPPGSRYEYEPQIGKSLEIRAVDAEGAELQLFKGILRQVDVEWEMNGSCQLTLSGIGPSYKRDNFNHSQTFNMLTLQACATRLLNGLGGDYVCSEPGQLNLIQFNETDWSFLHRIIERFGGFLRVKGDNIDIFDEFQPETVQIEWRTENGLQAFRSTGKLAPYKVFGVNFDTAEATSKQMVVSDAVASEAPLGDLRSYAQKGSDLNELESGLWNKFLSRDHSLFSQQLSWESRRQIIHSCTAYGESRAPEIVTGNKVELRGDFEPAGTYGVFKLTHHWAPGLGYRNQFYCTPYKKYLDANRPETQRNYGPEIARVIENDSGEPRRPYVKVAFLWQEENATSWLPVLTPNAGADRGFCFMPEVGDEVYVSFVGGDSTKPFILGSLWNGVDVAPLEDLHGGEYGTNEIKRIVTKSGNRLVFDDKQGQETVVMAGPNHVRVSLFDGGSTMVLHSDGDIKIHAGGTVHMKCKQFLREVGD